MTLLRIYEKYLEKLVKCLPMDDAHFIASLSSKQLLPGDVEDRIKHSQAQADKASYFLHHVIKRALDIGDSSSFKELLSVMQSCGYKHLQTLSDQIEQDINEFEHLKPGMLMWA